MTSPTTAPADRPLAPLRDWRLVACPACAYSLEGLPPTGVCPECGRAYDGETVILYGWGQGQRTNPFNCPPRLLAFVSLFGAIQLFGAWRAFVERNQIQAAVFAVVLVGIATWVFLRRSRRPAGSLTQVHIRPDGCRQVDGPEQFDGVPFTPWSRYLTARLFVLKDGTCRLTFLPRMNWLSSAAPHIDARVRCDRPLAEALNAQMREWRSRKGGVT